MHTKLKQQINIKIAFLLPPQKTKTNWHTTKKGQILYTACGLPHIFILNSTYHEMHKIDHYVWSNQKYVVL